MNPQDVFPHCHDKTSSSFLLSPPQKKSIVQILFISRNENHPCVCTCAIGELFINSLKCFCCAAHAQLGRKDAVSGYHGPGRTPTQSPVTLQMCVFLSAEGNTAGKSVTTTGLEDRDVCIYCMCVSVRVFYCI